MLKPFHYHRRGSLTPMAERTQKVTKIFKKLKYCKISIELQFLTISCSSVATTGGLQGDEGEGGGGQQCGVGQKPGGGGGCGWVRAIVGGQQRGRLQPLRTALHNISISLQNSLSGLKQS